jgi:transposase
MSKSEPRRTFTQAFKIESVQHVLNSEKTVSQVARDLGIKENNLRRWINEYQEDPEHSFPGQGYFKEPEEELRQLRKKLADVEMERDILKKALAIFSRPSH